MINLIIQNQQANPRSYSSGAIFLPASGTVTVPSDLMYETSRDGVLLFDCANFNVTLNDGNYGYSGKDAVDYLTHVADITGPSGTFVDWSGTATGTSTQIMPADLDRKYLFIQNLGNQAIYINFTNAATAGSGSILLSPLQSFVLEGSFVSTEAVFIIKGTGPNQPFTAKEG